MKRLIVILFSTVLLNCSDKEVTVQTYASGQKKVTYKILKGSEGNPIDFEYRAYYDHGALMKEGLMKNMKEEGEWKYYFDNGKMSSIGNFRTGVRTGKFIRYYESGEIEQEGQYANGEISQSTFFYRNGSVRRDILDPLLFIKDSPTTWTETQKKRISSRCNSVLQFEYKNSDTFCKCIVDTVSTYVEFHSLDTLSDYDRSLIYRTFMKAGTCYELFY
jgi:hypothetical protein